MVKRSLSSAALQKSSFVKVKEAEVKGANDSFSTTTSPCAKVQAAEDRGSLSKLLLEDMQSEDAASVATATMELGEMTFGNATKV
jgi:hypothetical protein